jgi:hypothetical protein
MDGDGISIHRWQAVLLHQRHHDRSAWRAGAVNLRDGPQEDCAWRRRVRAELVHNASGAGSPLVAIDLNKDGTNDIITGTELGAFVFFGKPRTASKLK